MRKNLLLLLFIFNVVLLPAQNVEKVKKERRIYLWDVTMSMQGYGGCKNIWNDVKTKLIKDIDGIMDPETEIILLPFQHKIIDSITVTANAVGKNELKNYISKYDLPRLWVGNAVTGHEIWNGEKGKTTMTKLYAPIIQCINSFIYNDRINVLVIMTDGVSDFADDQNRFEYLINEEWCDLAIKKDIYAFYFMLTPNAVIEKINEKDVCRIKKVDPEQTITFSTFVLRPDETIKYNVKDDFNKPIKIHFTTNTSNKIEDRYVIHVKSDNNDLFDIDEDVELDLNDNTITLKPKMKFDNAEMMRHYILNQLGNTKVSLSYESGQNMNKLNPCVSVSSIPTTIEFVVIKERTVNIKWINE